jgi:ABC-type spermidine/putrescine transport system permease subunit I
MSIGTSAADELRSGRSRFGQRTQQNRLDSWRPRWVWATVSLPGGLWLALLIVVPFYVVMCVAFGTFDPIFGSAVPVWNPAQWNGAVFVQLWHEVIGKDAFLLPPIFRTLWYSVASSALSLAIGFPVAYYVARHGGKRKGLLLLLLIAPFWISYMMRMLAWIDLLQTNGYVNKVLEWLHLMSRSNPYAWIGGKSITVILGLVYGYIPYLIVVLYAGLDRIDARLLEAGQDLGLSKWKTFWYVTVPLSRQTILAGVFITVLPIIGDFYTNQLLSASPNTTMIGNQIQGQLAIPNLEPEGAALSMVLLLALVVPMIYYVRSTARASRENV